MSSQVVVVVVWADVSCKKVVSAGGGGRRRGEAERQLSRVEAHDRGRQTKSRLADGRQESNLRNKRFLLLLLLMTIERERGPVPEMPSLCYNGGPHSPLALLFVREEKNFHLSELSRAGCMAAWLAGWLAGWAEWQERASHKRVEGGNREWKKSSISK